MEHKMYRGTGYDQYNHPRVWGEGQTENEACEQVTQAANEYEKVRKDLKINSFSYEKVELASA